MSPVARQAAMSTAMAITAAERMVAAAIDV